MTKYASMPVCQYAVYTCLHKKLNKKKERARPYPRLRDFYYQFQNQFWNSKGNVMRWHAPIVCCQEISDIENLCNF